MRAALRQAMKILGEQFVMGETIGGALRRAADAPEFLYSFDMLGEAALTAHDAQRYSDSYAAAIAAVGATVPTDTTILEAPSVSVKLSALSPRYDFAQCDRAVDEVAGRLLPLAQAARAAGIGLTIDAEEADRLELSLATFSRVHGERPLRDWNGLGIAVQAYQKRAPCVLRWLEQLARDRRGANSRAARQRRLLGHRDQTGPGPRPRRLPGVHSQAPHRSVVSRLRARHC